MRLGELSNILWRERRLLDLLLFKLDVEQTLLAAGRSRWLARATDEVELVLEDLRATELARAVAVDGVAGELGIAPGSTLGELAAAAPDPWAGILTDHRTALRALSDEVALVAHANRELVQRGRRALQDLIGAVGDAPDPFGTAPRRASVLVDEVL